MTQPLINGREYEFADINVLINGTPVTGLRGIKHKTLTDVEVIYGRGREPHALQSGNKSYEGEVSLLLSELISLHRTAIAKGGNDITDLRKVSIIVTYMPEEGGELLTRKILGAQFPEYEEGMMQGDKFQEIALPFKCLKIVNAS